MVTSHTSRVVDVPPNIGQGRVPVVIGEEEALVTIEGVGAVTVRVLIASVSEGCSGHKPVSSVSDVAPPRLQIAQVLSDNITTLKSPIV